MDKPQLHSKPDKAGTAKNWDYNENDDVNEYDE